MIDFVIGIFLGFIIGGLLGISTIEQIRKAMEE